MRLDPKLLYLSAGALAAIAGFEGYRATAYNDGVGVQTIGYGTTRYASGQVVRAGDKITPDRALIELAANADKFQVELRKCLAGVPFYQHEWDAIVSWAYNIGTAKACGSTAAARFRAGDYAGGCEAMTWYNRAGGRYSQGLANRRSAEYLMCIGEVVKK